MSSRQSRDHTERCCLQSGEGLPADCKTARQWKCPEIRARWILTLEPLGIYLDHRTRTDRGSLYLGSQFPLADEISADKEQLRLTLTLHLSEYDFDLILLVLDSIVGTQAVGVQ